MLQAKNLKQAFCGQRFGVVFHQFTPPTNSRAYYKFTIFLFFAPFEYSTAASTAFSRVSFGFSGVALKGIPGFFLQF